MDQAVPVAGREGGARTDQAERGGQWAKGKGCPTFGPIGPWLVTLDEIPDLKALQANINLTHELGFIKAPMDVSKYTDLSLAEEAAKRLK